MRKPGMLIVTLVAVLVAGVWVASGRAADEATIEPARVHSDAAAMEQAALEVLEALMRDDLQPVGPAVKRIEAGCNTLYPEDDDRLGQGFRNLDQALHVVLRGTRGYVAAKSADEAFTEFVWVLRTCRECHELARLRGHLPATGPMWGVGAETQSKPAETTQSAGE